MKASELLEEADVGVLVRPWLDVIDELLKLGPTISDPQEVAAGNPNRPSDADLRLLKPLPQAPQSRYPAAADPGPMNPEDNRRLSVYPHVEVEPTADVCPSGPARDAGDQGRDGRIIWAGSRSEPARQGRRRGRSFDSGHGNGPPAHPRMTSMVFQIVLLVLFLALAAFLLAAPDRHFRGDRRKLRIAGAVAFLIAALGALVNLIAG